MLVDKTNHTRLKLAGYAKILIGTWSHYSKNSVIEDFSKLISQITSARQQMYQEVVCCADKKVTAPSSATLRDYTSLLQGLREENEALRKQLSEEMNSSLRHKRKYDEAVADLQSSKLEKKEKELEDEGKKSLITYDKLFHQLAEFCKIGAQVARVRCVCVCVFLGESTSGPCEVCVYVCVCVSG